MSIAKFLYLVPIPDYCHPGLDPGSSNSYAIFVYQYYVYILASKKIGTLYIGVTRDLQKRIYEHKNHLADGFTKKYNVQTLVYFEVFNDINEAILREKRLKTWKRSWKLKHIEKENPEWKDLYEKL